VVRNEGCVVRIEGGVVIKCKLVVKTLKTVVKNKQFKQGQAQTRNGNFHLNICFIDHAFCQQ
jgi:hypothetical protein